MSTPALSLTLEHLGQNPAHHLLRCSWVTLAVSRWWRRGGVKSCATSIGSLPSSSISANPSTTIPLSASPLMMSGLPSEVPRCMGTNVRSRGMAWRLFSTCTSCQAATRAASRAASASSRARLRLRIASYIFFTSSGDAIFFSCSAAVGAC